MERPRICSVDFLNARPLVRGFTRGPQADRYDLSEASPALCADRLRSGAAEIGLIPSIEFQRIPGLRILPRICIASRRRARSVLLVSRVAAPEIRSVAVDTASRTSAALLRVLLDRRARHRVEYRPFRSDLRAMLAACEAALLIGDAALKADTQELRVYDLASEWFEMTGLPFVFAFWAVQEGVELPGLSRDLLESRSIGLEAIDRIAEEESLRLALPAPILSEYLKVNLHYELGEEETRSLWLFYRMAAEAGIAPGPRALAFAPAASAEGRRALAGGMA
jgi:chorismate dehydratase